MGKKKDVENPEEAEEALTPWHVLSVENTIKEVSFVVLGATAK